MEWFYLDIPMIWLHKVDIASSVTDYLNESNFHNVVK